MIGKAWAAACVLGILCSAVVIAGSTVGVLGFSSKTIDQRTLEVFGDVLETELKTTGLRVVSTAEVMRSAQSSGCGDAVARIRESCIRIVGTHVSAGFLLGGSINVIGTLHELRAELYSVQSGLSVWSSAYRVGSGLEDFYTKTPARLASDISQTVTTKLKAPSSPQDTAAGTRPQPTTAVNAQKGTSGVAPGLIIGVSGTFALGEAVESQSPYGGKLHVLYPTTAQSHARFKAGVPLYHDHWPGLDSRGKNPDVYLSLEHDWLWRKFSIGTGLSYMYLQPFSRYGTYGGDGFEAVYDAHHAFNIVLTLRGGRPGAGFYGRLAWPLPFTIDRNEATNILFEYSGLAVFGGTRVQAGLGVTGMYKRREADYVRYRDSTYQYERQTSIWYSSSRYRNFSRTTSNEYMVLLPVLRIAALLGGHVVVHMDLELGGTIFPRFPDTDWWQPQAGAGLTYSFGRLQQVGLMDGTF